MSHMNLQHSNNKRLGLRCNTDECTYLYNTVTTSRCHVARRHWCYWENVSTSPADLPVTDDIHMYVDDDYDETSFVSVGDNEERSLNTLLNDFAKNLAFLMLKIVEENILPAAASILNDVQVCFDTYQKQSVESL